MLTYLDGVFGRDGAIYISAQNVVVQTRIHSVLPRNLFVEPDKLPPASRNHTPDARLFYAERLCYLPMGQTFMLKEQATAYRLPYLIERLPGATDLGLAQQGFIRLRILSHLRRQDHKCLVARSGAATSPQHVLSYISSDSQEPCAQQCFVSRRARIFIEADENFLQNVFGQGAVTRQRTGVSIYNAVVRRKYFFEIRLNGGLRGAYHVRFRVCQNHLPCAHVRSLI